MTAYDREGMCPSTDIRLQSLGCVWLKPISELIDKFDMSYLPRLQRYSTSNSPPILSSVLHYSMGRSKVIRGVHVYQPIPSCFQVPR